ncbi:unnamed protein product [Didymodactylos carnosus]|uniref:Cyclin C-terminal domain-containing protein n=1 Tax=Didymodactylos carnosus TaxID=1234261 RepID=A0A814YIM0_9BILA|nr:unnamed protein product [Didymodactylos carnosus]CAF1230048.1 unnamed protein product [Didymodactylos carnosus]CAF3610653.1 unnamed protein product [Didymodactylos carnosus]CAF3992754.1 unnamed protein product [Didymodactylos carnosus]
MHLYNQKSEYPYTMKQILECEFYLLEIMDCCLIIYHPYRSLNTYIKEMQIDTPTFELTWRIINDSLKTDVSLLYPPYKIAFCLLLSCLHRDKALIVKQYLIDNFDIEQLYDIIKYLLKLYELMNTYDDQDQTLTNKYCK